MVLLCPVLVVAQHPVAKPGGDEAARERAMREQAVWEAYMKKELRLPRGFYYGTPNTRAVVRGDKTVQGYRLSHDARIVLASDSSGQVLIRLPSRHRKAAPQLLGMLDHGADVEVFLGWVDLSSEPGNFAHHIETFRGSRGQEATFVHDFKLGGGTGGWFVSFFEPPDSRDTPEVFIDISVGAYWGTTYLLALDRQSLARLFTFCDYEFADLDRDGVYELIAWNRRPFDVRCRFGIFGSAILSRGFRPRRRWLSKGVAASELGGLYDTSRHGTRKRRRTLGCESPDRGGLCRPARRWRR